MPALRTALSQQHFLRSADVFVLPSRSEGFSNTIIEAMTASLPVVTAEVGGNADSVQDGSTGFIIPWSIRARCQCHDPSLRGLGCSPAHGSSGQASDCGTLHNERDDDQNCGRL
jgi:hypothetical protein